MHCLKNLGFYFNLTKDSNCAKVAASGNVRSVVLNFIKKFQFPNMRTTAAFQDAKNVYMDTDAVLKSRPSIKKENLIDVATLVGKDYSISDVWTYGNVVVYVTHRAE